MDESESNLGSPTQPLQSRRGPSRQARRQAQVLDSISDASQEQEIDLRDSLRQISFETLSHVQSGPKVNPQRDRPSSTLPNPPHKSANDEKLATLRAHLATLKSTAVSKRKSSSDSTSTGRDSVVHPPKRSKTSALTDEETKSSRSSKHAPPIQSSKRPVSRYRPVLQVSAAEENPVAAARDPRFDSATTGSLDRTATRRNYAFLGEYAEKEITEMKNSLAALQRGERSKHRPFKVEKEIERLRKEIGARENRLKAKKTHEQEISVKSDIKRREREAVKQGKRPYYTKRSDVKNLVHEKRRASMKKGEMEKAEKRKRKRESGKQMKRLRIVQNGKRAGG